jgi:hypothetical protein
MNQATRRAQTPAASNAGVNLRHVRQSVDVTRECCARIIELCIQANRAELAASLIRARTTAEAAARQLAAPASGGLSHGATNSQAAESPFGPRAHPLRGTFDPGAAAQAARESGRLRAS